MKSVGWIHEIEEERCESYTLCQLMLCQSYYQNETNKRECSVWDYNFDNIHRSGFVIKDFLFLVLPEVYENRVFIIGV